MIHIDIMLYERIKCKDISLVSRREMLSRPQTLGAVHKLRHPFLVLLSKDELYVGYCGAIPIPMCWYWYSIVGSKKPSYSQYQNS